MDSDVRACMYEGKKNRMKVLYFSQKRFDEKIQSYYRKAERDWEEAMERRERARKGKTCEGSRRNVFMKARVGYVFPLNLDGREASIKRADEQRATGGGDVSFSLGPKSCCARSCYRSAGNGTGWRMPKGT